MKKLWVTIIIVLSGTIAPMKKASAQDPITEIIKAAVIKVIRAVDLEIQRHQNEVIWLQNAQKTVENTMSELKLAEISDWVEKQRTMYQDYYEELWKVKNIIGYYHGVKEITKKQVTMVNEYKKAYRLCKQDKNFTTEEILYIGRVYTGMIDESVKNLEQLFLVVNSFTTQMSDAKRLAIIDEVADQMDQHYNNLKSFNHENMMLSLQRAKTKNDIENVKQLYGLK